MGLGHLPLARRGGAAQRTRPSPGAPIASKSGTTTAWRPPFPRRIASRPSTVMPSRTACCRICEAARAQDGEGAVDRLYTAWGALNFAAVRPEPEGLLVDCVATAGLPPDLRAAADDEKWDAPIREAMEVAYAFGGPKTQTPTIVVRADPPHGFKGPVMASAPTGPDAVRLWDAIQGALRDRTGSSRSTRPPRTNPPARCISLADEWCWAGPLCTWAGAAHRSGGATRRTRKKSVPSIGAPRSNDFLVHALGASS